MWTIFSGFQLAASSSLSPAAASNHHEDQQQQQQQQQLEQQNQSNPPTPVIVMQRTTTATTRNDKTIIYPNTRGGKRKMVEETPVVVKNLRGKRRLLAEDLDRTCPLVPVHLQPRLDEEDVGVGETSCLLLRDEVVPQALSPTSARSSTSTTTASTTLIYIKPEVRDLYQTGNAWFVCNEQIERNPTFLINDQLKTSLE